MIKRSGPICDNPIVDEVFWKAEKTQSDQDFATWLIDRAREPDFPDPQLQETLVLLANALASGMDWEARARALGIPEPHRDHIIAPILDHYAEKPYPAPGVDPAEAGS